MSSSPEILAARPNLSTGKAKAVPVVVELTDSEDELDLSFVKTSSRNIAKAGPSRLRSTPRPLLASASNTQNLPSYYTQKGIPDDNALLSISSNEENVPPSHPVEQVPVSEILFTGVQVEDLTPESSLSTPPTLLAQVMELVPDVQPDYATELIVQQSAARPGEVVEAVIHALFGAPYPKVDKKGKRKSVSEDEGQRKRPRVESPDYSTVDREHRGGPHYEDLSVEHLMVDFPDIPKPYIRRILSANKGFYTPTHLHLLEEKKRGPPFPYVPKKSVYKPSKGKQRALVDIELEQERAGLLNKLKDDLVKKDLKVAEKINEEEYEGCGDGIECGCCFSTYPFDKMIQCPEAHLFCTECMSSYAENLLGSHNDKIICMDQSGCKLPFPVSELRRFLSDKLLDLYERVKQRKEIEMAGLDGLEECPFCDFKCVIENPDEKLLRCGNDEACGAVTCRRCKKMDHLPKSCKEMEEDKALDGRHLIEEAMTQALMRNCPQCNKSFVKEDGQSPPGASGPSVNSNKCPLWEPVEVRHAAEVKAAAAKAMEEYKRDNPDVSETDIKVDLPPSPPRPQIAPVGGMGYGAPGMPGQNARLQHAAAQLDLFNARLGQLVPPQPNMLNRGVVNPYAAIPQPLPVIPAAPRPRRARRR
ncbi:hypothetical protein D9757_002039 [Collybiopsis confluens]|uniref:RING-type domain-containing protein n=1 Tax=Collybiopsis confluens TaxID=2823264 RepID=A0A8H5HY23_9AGAR|nr:hypothetical protein D9757_002039 [Collybiopsis confluens]